ncbi:hypothetical protein BJV78DRAFT_1275395 [Lactifluus subvellereus]|nr:hypothetical protein BJV78DRAFT_1275395 [Lactifluus subvellereus]
MDKFVTVTSKKPTHDKNNGKEGVHRRYNPYPLKDTSDTGGPNKGGGSKSCAKTLTRHLLNTLSDESNPITHSDIGLRSGQSDGRAHRQAYVRMRSQKLKDQREEVVMRVLNDTRIYINGYLQDTTDIEMKRIITEAGGRVMHSASNATHIVTSQRLSGIKTHGLLTSSSKRKPVVVKPEWVKDCIAAGKRLREGKYLIC